MRQSPPTRTLYPPIQPYDSGLLDVGDGHRIYWETSGNPDGKPVVFLHGGPGSGCGGMHRQQFDPKTYRIVLFDQRNCGRSTPSAGDIAVSPETNTTWHLVADMEKLRERLGIARWLLFGGSWGSALALAYAQAFPARVTGLVLRGAFTLRRSEIQWYYQEGASRIFPDLWEDFVAPIPTGERHDLLTAYHRRLSHPDPAVRLPAAPAWSRWEGATVTLRPHPLWDGPLPDEVMTAFSRIENHYFVNGGFFDEGQLIRDVQKIRDIPCVIVQGRYDMCTPIATAWDLYRAWPEADLHIVDDAGHAFTEPGILHHLIQATDRFAAQVVD
jgi:proline iminopeptidase